jgi:hypothetical protein
MNHFVSTSSVINVIKFNTPIHTPSNHKKTIYVGDRNKNFKMITKTIETDNKIIIKRNISWYDCVEKIYRKKVELQVFNCGLEEPVHNINER